MEPSSKPDRVCFGPFEADLRSSRLQKKGRRVKLQQQPFQILAALLDRPGQLVTREELVRRVWPADVFVDYDHSLNKAVNKLRDVLGDSSQEPRYIETQPRRGYRFIAPLKVITEPQLNEKAAQVRPAISVPGSLDSGVEPTPPTGTLIRSVWQSWVRPATIPVMALAIVLALAFSGYRWSWHRGGAELSPARLQLTKLTESRKAERAAISPDGRYVVYAVRDHDGLGLWVRQVTIRGGAVQILPPEAVEFAGLTFSPDSNYVYFVRSDKNDSSFRCLYKVPVLGGMPQLLLRDVDSPVSFSPDAHQFVFTRAVPRRDGIALHVANVEGNGDRLLATIQDAAAFHQSGPAWSPDGHTIVVSVLLTGKQVRWVLETVSVADGSVRELYSSPYKIGRPLWLHGGDALLLALDDQDNHGQLWAISFPGGELRRLTNDLTDYEDDRIDLARDGKTAVIITWDMTGDVWEAPATDLSRAHQLESSSLPFLDVAPGPGGKILVSGLDSQLRIMDPDGTERGLFADAHPAGSPVLCGRFIVFISRTFQHPAQGLMRMDMDGSNITRLTSSRVGSAACSPDGKFIFYDNLDYPQKIRKLAVESGPPIDITNIPVDVFANQLSLSPDGELLAYVYRELAEPRESAWKLVVFPAGGGPAIGTYRVPGEIRSLRWSPGGQGLQYTIAIFAGGAANIWEQPLAGGEPRRLTRFASGRIYDFNWSADGRHLLMTRGDLNGDVVLLSNFR